MNSTHTPWQELATRVLTVAQIRDVDRQAVEKYHMNSLVLMENAALGCVHFLTSRFPAGTTAVVLCGRGNNGGDGLAIARHLRVLGWNCQVAVSGPVEQMSADARANLEIMIATGRHELIVTTAEAEDTQQLKQIEEWILSANVIIDAMLGTGASSDPRPPYREWIRAANSANASRIAIDIPTGWDANTGRLGEPTFRAHATLTFLAKKPAMIGKNTEMTLGEIVVLPIGIPEEHIRELLQLESGSHGRS
jgi:NAD(P)H-hydrate epimerase